MIYQGHMSSNDLWPADPVSYPDLSDFLAIKIVRDHMHYFPRSYYLLGFGTDVSHPETVPTHTYQQGFQLLNLLDYLRPKSIFINIIFRRAFKMAEE